MTNLIQFKTNTTHSKEVISRMRAFHEREGFSKIGPVCWTSNGKLSVADVLTSTSNNFPFGFAPNEAKYVKNISFHWGNIPRDIPVTQLAISIVLGMECYIQTILLNTGKKKVKTGNKWGHRSCKSDAFYREIVRQVNLNDLTDEYISSSITQAQLILDEICKVEFEDSPQILDKIQPQYAPSLLLINLSTSLLNTNVPLTIDQRVKLMNLKKVYQFRTPESCVESYIPFFKQLLDSGVDVTFLAGFIVEVAPHCYLDKVVQPCLDAIGNQAFTQAVQQNENFVLFIDNQAQDYLDLQVKSSLSQYIEPEYLVRYY